MTAGLGETNKYEGINIWSYTDIVYIQTPHNINGDIVIYDMVGQEVIQEQTNPDGLNQIRITKGTGYYFVKVISEQMLYTEKVLIQ